MSRARDYRKRVTRALLLVFYGLLAAAVAPDFGIGIKPYAVSVSVLAVAVGVFRMSAMPVHGFYRPLMTVSGILISLYLAAFLFVTLRGLSEAVSGWVSSAAKGVGAIGLLLLCAAMEIFCRRLKWARLARAWAFTLSLVGLVYVVPVALGWFWSYYSAYILAWRPMGALYYALTGFDFHGVRVPGAVGASKWLVLLALALLAPVTVLLVNLMRTYVRAASPSPPPDDSQPIPWSRR